MQHLTSISNRMSIPSALIAATVAMLSTGCIYTGDVDDYLDTIAASELGITSIEIESPNTRMAVSFTEQFSATGLVDFGDSETDLTDEVTWTVSSMGSISDSGLLSSDSDTGVITVTAQYAEMSATKSITVSSAALQSLTITGADNVDACTYESEFTATGSYGTDDERNINANVAWSTDTPTLAIVDTDGVMTTYGDGTVDVEATLSSITAAKTVTLDDGLTSIAITPFDSAEVDVYLTIDQQFTATGTYSSGDDIDITDTVAWSSDDTAIADFSDESGENGLLVPASEGSIIITASCDSDHPDTQGVLVKAEPTVESVYIEDAPSITVDLSDGEVQLQAFAELTNGDITDITSADDAFWVVIDNISGTTATVDNDDGDEGLVSFSGVGQNEIEIRYTDDNETYEASIIVVVE